MTIDAIVVGSGPNGLAAAITLARAGRSVRLYEAEATVGGGARSAELTQPGFVHDVCATIHSLALVSPFLKTLPLAEHGLEFAHPIAPLAHPLDDGTAIIVRAIGRRNGAAALSARDARGISTRSSSHSSSERDAAHGRRSLGPPGFRDIRS